ncbi:MAG TPA: glycosyltransferase family 39 protein, partial [Bacteroidota bacterium]
MLSHLPESSRERVFLAAIALAGLLRFVNLGFLDLQAWDESLYAIRAEGILRFGGWIDQTPFAIDGLYSSLHPPVYVWLTAIAMKIFGNSEFSIRFFSALLGALTLFVIYRIGKKIANAEVGLLAALLFGLNPFVSFYARQGQFDSVLVFFLALSVYFLISVDPQQYAKTAVLAGVSLGMALMTKLYVAFGIPVAYLLWLFTTREEMKTRLWKNFGIIVFAASIVAAPWYIYMTIAHGNGNALFFLNASALWERTVSGIEGNVKPLETFYFVNQLFVVFPAAVLWFAYGLWNSIRSREEPWLFVAVWLLVFFVVFSIMRTKLAVYLLPMFVPASLFAAKELGNAIAGKISTKATTALVGGTLLTILWSSSQEWRNAVKDVLLLRFESETLLTLLPFFALALGALIITFVLFRFAWTDIVRRALPYFIIIPSFLWSLYHVFYLETFQYNDGGKALADFVSQQGVERLVVAGYER